MERHCMRQFLIAERMAADWMVDADRASCLRDLLRRAMRPRS